MSTAYTRTYNWVNDKNAGTPITSARMDTEHDDITTKLNQKVLIKATAPTSPIAGMFWLDSTNKLLKEYRNTEWVIHGVVHLATTAPTTPQVGDLWFDTTTVDSSGGVLKAYGSAWRFYLSAASLGTTGQLLVSQGLGSNPEWTDFATAPLPNSLLALDTNSRFPASVMAMQLGSVALAFSNVSVASAAVTFDSPFSSTPIVGGGVARLDATQICEGFFAALSVNTAGFMLRLREYEGALVTGTEQVSWWAMGDY